MDKKSYYCKKLESTLNFLPDYIKFCCSCAICPGLKIKDFNNINKKEVLEARNKIITSLEEGIIPRECKNCVEYKEKKPYTFIEKLIKKRTKITSIIVNHFKECDCNCIYCSQKIIYENSTNTYKLAPIIKDLYKNNLINKKELEVEFQGGNVSVLKEFDEIMNILLKNSCKIIRIFTNGIKYLEIIEEVQKSIPIEIVISLDSGTNETFKRIKQVDKLNDVIENIQKYTKFPNIFFSLKYIIIKDVNDNIEELQHFIDIASTIRNVSVRLDIDYRDIMFTNKHEPFIVPEHYYKIIDLAKEYAKKKNIELTVNGYSNRILNEGKTTK